MLAPFFIIGIVLDIFKQERLAFFDNFLNYAMDLRRPGFGMDSLLAYPWPGNVRELENRIKRAVIMAEGNIVTPADLDLASGNGRYERVGIKEAREALEKQLILKALARHRSNLTQTALDLRISRPTLYDLMAKLGIEKEKVVG